MRWTIALEARADHWPARCGRLLVRPFARAPFPLAFFGLRTLVAATRKGRSGTQAWQGHPRTEGHRVQRCPPPFSLGVATGLVPHCLGCWFPRWRFGSQAQRPKHPLSESPNAVAASSGGSSLQVRSYRSTPPPLCWTPVPGLPLTAPRPRRPVHRPPRQPVAWPYRKDSPSMATMPIAPSTGPPRCALLRCPGRPSPHRARVGQMPEGPAPAGVRCFIAHGQALSFLVFLSSRELQQVGRCATGCRSPRLAACEPVRSGH